MKIHCVYEELMRGQVASWVKSPQPVITGSTPICSSTPKTFSATNWNSAYTWVGDKVSIASPGSSSTSVTANGSGSGYVRIMAGSYIVAQYNVWIGGPPITNMLGPSSVPAGAWSQFQPSCSSASSYQWVVSPSSGVSINNYGDWASINFPSEGSNRITCWASSSCGTGPGYDHFVYVGN